MTRLIPVRAEHIAVISKGAVTGRTAGAMAQAGLGYALLGDAGLLACAGAVPLHKGVGQGWAFIAGRCGVTVARETRAMLPIVMRQMGLRRLQATVEWDNDRGLRFACWLGFRPEGKLRAYGANGEDHMMLALVREGDW